MNAIKKLIPDMVAILVFAVISFAYFCPAVTEGRILSQHDSVAGIGAGQEGKEYLERTGERTRWTNSIFGGMPTYQMAPSYDSTDLLKGIENLYHLYLPTYVWYVFVMLLGFYILLRAFNFKVWLAGLGAIIWRSLPISLSSLRPDISGSSLLWLIFRLPLPVWCFAIEVNIGWVDWSLRCSWRCRFLPTMCR